jgi:hypothetical protein
MKTNWLSWFLAFTAMLACSVSALAQHGAAGAGRPMGTGPSSIGGTPSGAGRDASGRPSNVGSTGIGHSSMGSQSPTTALDNGKLNTSLTNALAKGGVSVPGDNLQSACLGFKNLGQCVAALHVAKNVNLSFDDLKNKMTGSNSENLGKAIQDLAGPNVNGKSEAKKANKQASQDLNAAESAS